MANTSTNFTTLDFESVKQNFKEYLKSQKIFQDYDFEGSNINVLLDVLSYNTQLNGFYLNMIGNEMFLDSALLRDSVVSHAKELNYLPRSFRSAVANVNITIQDSVVSSVLIPKGTSFTGTAGTKNFTFVTDKNIAVGGSGNVFVANSVALYEGDYTSDSYVVNYADPVRYLITNKTVDINSIDITVIEDNGATVIQYARANSLFGLNTNSEVFFVQAAENETYEITFGDGVTGRAPKDRSVVVIQYRACNGELPNGIRKFVADGEINGTGVVTEITVNSPATGGAISESLSSIKFNAPRAFTVQERAITIDDYRTLLLQNFSDLNDVFVYGGEEETPPQYGKVFVAVDLKNTDDLPRDRRIAYEQFLKPRTPLSIDPIFVVPNYLYVKVDTTVKYNINRTSLSSDDIKSLVETAIMNYNFENLEGFNKTLYYSNLVTDIDDAQNAIVSNDTEVKVIKSFIPSTQNFSNYDINFELQLKDNIGQLSEVRPSNEISVIRSSNFRLDSGIHFIEDDGEGILRIVRQNGETIQYVQDIGTVNYDTGFVQISNFRPRELINNRIDIYAIATERDISSRKRTVLRIRPSDISITVQQVAL